MTMDNGEQVRLERITIMLVELSKGNFDVRAELTQNDDLLNSMLAGLNMLADELAYFKSQLNLKTILLENTLHSISEVVYAIRITGTDIDSIKHEFISQRVHELLGYTVDEIYSDSGLWFKSIHDDDANVVNDALQMLLKGEEVTCEYRIKSKNGSEYVWVEDRMSPGRKRNTYYTEIFCAARNVTLRRRFYEEREQLIKELDSKYNELTQFNYIVSHNLRSPVAGILGACSLLQMDLDEADRGITYNLIAEAATKLDNLLKDLNSILSAKSKINEQLEAFSISGLLQEIKQMLASDISGSHVTLSIDVTPKADMLISLKGYIHSCMYNLISNAIKYRRKEVKTKINVKVWKEYQTTYFEISDNGTGIDMLKHQNEIFGLYKRFNTDTEGKGMGLHMTKVQIESLGGNILIDSTPGKGTKFLIHLPQ